VDKCVPAVVVVSEVEEHLAGFARDAELDVMLPVPYLTMAIGAEHITSFPVRMDSSLLLASWYSSQQSRQKSLWK
jgi:hypothetical protein